MKFSFDNEYDSGLGDMDEPIELAEIYDPVRPNLGKGKGKTGKNSGGQAKNGIDRNGGQGNRGGYISGGQGKKGKKGK